MSYVTHYEGASAAGYFTGEGDSQREILLTFDDGPSVASLHVCKILEEAKIHATFFVLGKQVQEGIGSEIVAALFKYGNIVGNHSMTHPFLPSMGLKRIAKEIDECAKLLPVPCKFFRPPFGCMDERGEAAVKERNLVPVLWNVSSYDWKLDNAAKIVAKVRGNLRPGRNVILFHDGDAKGKRDCMETVAAVKEIIQIGLQEGYTFRTIAEVL